VKHATVVSRTGAGASLVVALLLGSLGCGGSSTAGPDDPGTGASGSLTPVAETSDWPASTPDEQRVDAARLTDVLNRVRNREYGGINSLLVVRNERLIMEEYFNGWTAARTHTQQSVSKSVASLAAGLAVDGGALRLDDRVTDFFPDYQPIAGLDANKRALTVRDLLTMRTGLDWSEQAYQGSPLDRLNNCSCDWIRFMLDWPMREPPGSRWEYVSGGVILLGAVVGRAVESRVDLLLDAELFSPLAFREARWLSGQPQGLPHTGGGLYLRPRDMAKLGTLVASGGRWRGQQLVSEAWLRESTQTRPETVNVFAGRPATYGYLWWGLPGGVITAAGARGQWILVVPDRQLVVVSTAENADAQWAAPVQILYDHILPATRS
jgi:CubicO group peptidase (beta-lactamase class C family)